MKTQPALSVLAFLALTSCKANTFSGSNQGNSGADGTAVPTSMASPPVIPTIGAGSPSGVAVDAIAGRPCIDGQVDMNIMFLVDTTGSMSSQAREAASGIPIILQQIEVLRTRLSGKLREPRMGFIGYIDQLRYKNGVGPLLLAPTKDLNLARTYITNNSSAGSDSSDRAEGGLWAFAAALDNMKRTAVDATGAINVVFVLTDAWSHDGSSSSAQCAANPNDCRGPRTANTMVAEQLMADPYFRSLMIFDWSPSSNDADGDTDFVDGTTTALPSPKGQWAALRTKWQTLQKVPNAPGGAHLGDELRNGTSGMSNAMAMILDQAPPCAK